MKNNKFNHNDIMIKSLKIGKIEIGKYKLNDWYYYNQKLKNWQMILKIVELTFKSIITTIYLSMANNKNRINKCCKSNIYMALNLEI